MSALKIALATLWAPGRALKEAADGRLVFWPLLLATLVGLLYTALYLPRADLVRVAEQQLDAMPAEAAAKLTPHEREEKIETAGKLSVVGAYASAAAMPALSALAAAFCFFLAFKVAGGQPTFGAALAVLAHAQLPGACRSLLSVPALLTRGRIQLEDAFTLLPSSLAALAPEGTSLPRLALLSSVDLFSAWALVMVALGMAHAGKVSLLRSSVVTGILYLSFALVFRFALPNFAAAAAAAAVPS